MNSSEAGTRNIVDRMSDIEKGLRFWKLCTIALMCLFCIGFLTAAQSSAPVTLRAKNFVLVSDDGTPRAELRMHAQEPELVFFNRDGKTIPLGLSGHPAIVLSSLRNTATLTVGEAGPQITLANSEGYAATIGNIQTGRGRGGTETNPSDLSIAISDVRGKILWSAP